MRRESLPIFEIERDLLEAARETRRLVIRAPTGSGKSTQVPQMLLDAGLLGDGCAVILQPRRLPTRWLAHYVAQERGVGLGEEVGYQIRFDRVAGPKTRLLYETEGVLLRQMISDPDLSGVSAIFFDEFHERHLYTDVTLALALQLQRERRPDLLLVVMSATLPPGAVEEALAPCRALEAQGRSYPVSVRYLERPPPARAPIWEVAVSEFERAMEQDPSGDTLIFMPGAYEIAQTLRALERSAAARGRILLPLHGDLPMTEQHRALMPADRPKVIVSTNVAESSLTIEGIRLVVDSGLARVPRYDPARGLNTLGIEPISRASADQRAGRAGRTAPGRCARLWTEREHAARPAQDTPEIHRLDLSEVLLTLKALHVRDAMSLPWVDPPKPEALERAEQLLRDLGALETQTGELTEWGRRMAIFPMHPRCSRMLLEADRRRCVRAVAWIAALMQGRSVLLPRAGPETQARRATELGESETSDFVALLRAVEFAARADLAACEALGIHLQAARQTQALAKQLLALAEQAGLTLEDTPASEAEVRRCILAGFSDHVARRVDEGTLRCLLTHGRRGMLSRESSVRRSRFLVACEVREIGRLGGDREVMLNLAAAIEPSWLEELYPNEVVETLDVEFDSAERRVVCWRRRLFRELPLEERRVEPPPAERAAEVLAEQVLKGNIHIPDAGEALEQWIARVDFLARNRPDLGLPAIGPAERREIMLGTCQGAYSARDLKGRSAVAAFKDWLGPERRAAVERHAPDRLELDNGKRARLTYRCGEAPRMAIAIQDLYGVTETPRVAGVPVVLEILAPNRRPVQITQDLARFWREHYPRVKSELQRKYPRHEWR